MKRLGLCIAVVSMGMLGASITFAGTHAAAHVKPVHLVRQRPPRRSLPVTLATARKVDLNTADLGALMKLSGIGLNKAKAILAYREQHGNFHHVKDLSAVHGISQKLIAKFKDQVILG